MIKRLWFKHAFGILQGFYRDLGKSNGNYYIIIGYILGFLKP